MDSLENNQYSRYIVLVGISKKQAQTIEKYQDKVICLLDEYIDDVFNEKLLEFLEYGLEKRIEV